MAPAAVAALDPQYYVTEQKATQLLSHLSAWKQTKPKDQLRLDGFPSVLRGPMVWKGSELGAREDEWLTVLSKQDVEDIEKGLAHFQGLGLDAPGVSKETFPLPAGLKTRLTAISEACYNGLGFFVLRGLDPAKYTNEQNALIFLGVSAHVASERGFQDRKREQIMCHVVNAAEGNNMKAEKVTSPGFTAGGMSFHSDEGEILSLYVQDTAEAGGRTKIASGWHIYNELASTRPEILKKLADSWTLDTFQDYSEYPPKLSPFIHATPAGKVLFTFSRYPLTGFGPHRKRNSSLPPVSASQLETLDAVEVLAKESAFALPTARGDVLYLNNMALLHGREEFSEGGQKLKRHLLKLCLRDPDRGDAWGPLPEDLQGLWDEMYGGNSGEDGTARREVCCVNYFPGQETFWARNG